MPHTLETAPGGPPIQKERSPKQRTVYYILSRLRNFDRGSDWEPVNPNNDWRPLLDHMFWTKEAARDVLFQYDNKTKEFLGRVHAGACEYVCAAVRFQDVVRERTEHGDKKNVYTGTWWSIKPNWEFGPKTAKTEITLPKGYRLPTTYHPVDGKTVFNRDDNKRFPATHEGHLKAIEYLEKRIPTIDPDIPEIYGSSLLSYLTRKLKNLKEITRMRKAIEEEFHPIV